MNKADANNCTIRLQQERNLMQESGKLIYPREILLRDLEKEIHTAHEKSEQVKLMGNFNKDIEKGERINQFLQSTGLVNIHSILHETEKPAVTYDRGQLCLDMLAASPTNCNHLHS